mmetsp:Transcript_43807/g.70995  ORF Transcript_43807/g.70995 Transcript_43807/m.70995 type:complete len:142 (+) Transcript_43807:87-512(+)
MDIDRAVMAPMTKRRKPIQRYTCVELRKQLRMRLHRDNMMPSCCQGDRACSNVGADIEHVHLLSKHRADFHQYFAVLPLARPSDFFVDQAERITQAYHETPRIPQLRPIRTPVIQFRIVVHVRIRHRQLLFKMLHSLTKIR